MIYNVRLLILFLGVACTLFMVLGLIRPWAMLWWEDVQNRKKVLGIYGTLSVILWTAWYILKFLT